MMPRPVHAALVIALVSLPGAARPDPTNYDECILDAMKGVSSDVAARAIIDSCRRLFPADREEAPGKDAAPAQDSVEAAAVAGAAAAHSAESAPEAAAQGATASESVRELTKGELQKLESKGYFFGASYRVKVHNGNDNLRLTELTIAVWDKDNIDSLETYRTAVDIPPLDEGSARYTVVYRGEEATWAWKVVGAKGAE